MAPTGKDTNPGTHASPLATPQGAVKALRELAVKNPKARQEGVVVTFADGTYSLETPVVLGAADGGRKGAPVVWRAANAGAAVFSGATRLTGWRRVSEKEDAPVWSLLSEAAQKNVIVAPLPADLTIPGFRGGGCGTPEHLQEIPLALFQGAKRLEPARWPNDAFAKTGRPLGDPAPGRSTSGEFAFDKAKLAQWAKEPDLWAYGLWRFEWSDARCQVTRVQPDFGSLTVDAEPIAFGLREGAPFHVLNAFTELDRAGEWAVDRKNRRLYLWPVKGLPHPTLLCREGLVKGEGVSDFVLEGFVFEGARTTALDFTKAERVRIWKSIVRNTCAWGVTFRDATDCHVEGCDLYELGEGGIQLAGGDFATLTPGRNVADNNHIHHYGQVIPNYKQGVRLDGVGNRATHNLIHHTKHQAIEFNGNDHYIGYNVVHDACLYNNDAGAIYSCQRNWAKRGTVIEFNIVHMTGKQPRATNDEAIYLDDYSSGTTVRYNAINRATRGVFLGGGHGNDVYGNLIINASCAVIFSGRGEASFSKKTAQKGRDSEIFRHLEKNPELYRSALWRTRYPELLKVYEMDPVQAHDAHFNRVTNNVFVTSGTVQKENCKRIEPTCTVAGNRELDRDPGFADYLEMDWRCGEPLLKPLFDNWEKIGLFASPKRISEPVRFGEGLTPPRELGPEYAPAHVRIDLVQDNLPAGVDKVATDCVNCEVPTWGGGRRIMACESEAFADWTDYTFSFVPTYDGTIRLDTMGVRGEKTLYDDFRATGTTIRNPSFEKDGDWSKPWANPNDDRYPVCNTRAPYGIVTEKEAKCAAPDGKRMACGNDMLNFTQELPVKKGERVTISFKARAL